jgi:hypothetical protein
MLVAARMLHACLTLLLPVPGNGCSAHTSSSLSNSWLAGSIRENVKPDQLFCSCFMASSGAATTPLWRARMTASAPTSTLMAW